MKALLWVFILLLPFQEIFAADIAFIVNSQTQVDQLSVGDIRDFYYKRKRQWPDKTAVRFIDRAPDSEIRKTFLSSILKISSEDLELFWIGQKLYSGDSAPLQQRSEALTLQLVSSMKGSISYVSADTAIPKGIKVIKVENGSF